MKIKHFQGYGSVQAKKVSKTIEGDKVILVVEVKGNHEWGLVVIDNYDAKHWLFDRFEKNFKGDEHDMDISIESKEVKENGIDVDVAIYTFIYDKC